uniref:Uncharacterized protein n=1 Tax=viral metagenome TaxID=1070528 RepID=A0A6C0DBB5_9ZZZZ
MLWLVALFIVLQPGIFSKKNIPVKIVDILLRAVIFALIVYFLQDVTEGFQENPTCNPPDGYVFISLPGSSKTQCLKEGVDLPITLPEGNSLIGISYNDSQRITINSGGRYYTAPLMTQSLWNTDAGPVSEVFQYTTHNAVFIGVKSKLAFIQQILDKLQLPNDKLSSVSSFLNSFVYEIPPTGTSFTLVPQKSAAAPPLPIEPLPADFLKGPQRPMAGSEMPPGSAPPGDASFPRPPPGYQQAAFFEQNDINKGFDAIDTNLKQLSYGIKNLFNRSAPPPPP